MTDSSAPRGPEDRVSPLDEAHFDGFTVDQLSDYLDLARTPRDEAIESSAAAQNALAALSRLRKVAAKLIEAEAEAAPVRAPSWFKAILDQIGVQAHAGRDIPLHHDDARAHLAISEGAVRALIRTAGDGIDGVLVERSRLEGTWRPPASRSPSRSTCRSTRALTRPG
ncbi:hypothetical protein [Naasia aerilata]|uniref:DUF222 domain-containing protein n=1 Tax=Naasia aerilata TaxID=1162966 RepID=A0ABM8GC20_9MICO|nr:hypothetical protein [Naasia aerilata]BDZ45786.1 hypothetical protein GCM10025866_16950 [Naasia aerilata]